MKKNESLQGKGKKNKLLLHKDNNFSSIFLCCFGFPTRYRKVNTENDNDNNVDVELCVCVCVCVFFFCFYLQFCGVIKVTFIHKLI